MQAVPHTANKEQPNRCIVSVPVGESGYYTLLSDVDLVYSEEAITEIRLENPTLLAFRASERWAGGYYVYSHEQIQTIIETLRHKNVSGMQSIIEELERGFLKTEAST